jgi:rhodanese-related sulfurtransferase
MKKVIIGVVIVAILGVATLVLFGEKSSNTTAEPVDTLTFTAVQADVQSGAQLIDVRTIEEFEAGHFENAINLPVEEIQEGKMPSVEKDTTIYVYCRSGNRSAQAKIALEAAGYTDVVDLGGLTDVEAIGGEQV